MMNIPHVGYGPIQQVLDFNNDLLVQYLPSIDYCQKFKLPLTGVNLKEIFAKYADPSTGLLEHLGV